MVLHPTPSPLCTVSTDSVWKQRLHSDILVGKKWGKVLKKMVQLDLNKILFFIITGDKIWAYPDFISHYYLK